MVAANPPKSHRLINITEVQARVGLRSTAIYSAVARGDFPQPVRISARCTRWYADDIDVWIANLPRGVGARPGKQPTGAGSPATSAASV
jgi:prophage regulatory protein